MILKNCRIFNGEKFIEENSVLIKNKKIIYIYQIVHLLVAILLFVHSVFPQTPIKSGLFQPCLSQNF